MPAVSILGAPGSVVRQDHPIGVLEVCWPGTPANKPMELTRLRVWQQAPQCHYAAQSLAGRRCHQNGAQLIGHPLGA